MKVQSSRGSGRIFTFDKVQSSRGSGRIFTFVIFINYINSLVNLAKG